MFERFRKKSTKVLDTDSGKTKTIPKKELPTHPDNTKEPKAEFLHEHPIIDASVGNVLLDKPIDSEYSVDLNLDGDTELSESDVDKMRTDLTEAIKEDILAEETPELMEARISDMEEIIGITQHEWDTIYNNPQLLGYSDRQEQALVFKSVLPSEYNSLEDTILDVGCGVGDLWAYINEVRNTPEPLYTGIDSDVERIQLAHTKFPEITSSLLPTSLDGIGSQKFDWVVAMSVFNETPNTFDIEKTIDDMYQLSNKGISLNLMHTLPEGIEDGTMRTFDPIEILKWAHSKYKNVKIQSNLNYINRDFILNIYK